MTEKRQTSTKTLAKPTLARLAQYHQISIRAGEDGREYISSAHLANLLEVDETLVRKDMASAGILGKPRVGYATGDILDALDRLLGFREQANAILIGCGSLGTALLRYPGFAKYGLRVTAAFDNDHAKVGHRVGEFMILPMEKCRSVIDTFRVEIAILTVRADAAQSMTDWLVQRGIKAFWNFAPVKLRVPPNIIVRDENLALGLAQLIHHYRRATPVSPELPLVPLEEV